MKYICSKCGKAIPVTARKSKCDCGGLWKLDYKPPKFDLSLIDRDTWSLFVIEHLCQFMTNIGVKLL